MFPKKMLHYTMLCCVLLWSFLQIPSVQAFPWENETYTCTWYTHYPETHNVSGVFGYVLNKTAPSQNYTYSEKTKSGDHTCYYGVKVYVVHGVGSQTELTTGYNVNVSRSAVGSGIQSVNWKPPETTLNAASDAIRINFYQKIDGDAWQEVATFITDPLMSNRLINETWTFDLYTERLYSSGVTKNRFFWGGSQVYSRVKNVKLGKLSPWEEQRYYMGQGDLVSFLLNPWFYYIENVFYGIMVLFIIITMYNKYGDVRVPIVFLWIFAGTGGILTILIPAIGLHLAWFLLAAALASTLFILFTR